MRRISDGVKVSERYRTTEQVERAFVEDREHTFLYESGEGFHFMNPEAMYQVVMSSEDIGDGKAFLQEGMAVILSIHEGIAIAIELPRHVTLEITETEPTTKGQTASFLQARYSLNGPSHPGATAYPGRHPRRHRDRRHVLRRARQGLIRLRRLKYTAGVLRAPVSFEPLFLCMAAQRSAC